MMTIPIQMKKKTIKKNDRRETEMTEMNEEMTMILVIQVPYLPHLKKIPPNQGIHNIPVIPEILVLETPHLRLLQKMTTMIYPLE